MRVELVAAMTLTCLAVAACGSDGGEMAADTAPAPTPAPMPMPAEEPAAMPEQEAMLTTNDASLLAEPTWAVLFAGHDTMSFTPLGGANWEIVDGAVQADDRGEPGFLVTNAAFTDFHIRVEFQASSESNSGIFIRCPALDVVNAEDCYEINVFDENENPNNRTGAIVNHAPPAQSVMAGDAWNTYDIIAQGTQITVRFNDTVTAEIDNDEHTSGYIALQSNGGPIKFRDVRIRPL